MSISEPNYPDILVDNVLIAEQGEAPERVTDQSIIAGFFGQLRALMAIDQKFKILFVRYIHLVGRKGNVARLVIRADNRRMHQRIVNIFNGVPWHGDKTSWSISAGEPIDCEYPDWWNNQSSQWECEHPHLSLQRHHSQFRVTSVCFGSDVQDRPTTSTRDASRRSRSPHAAYLPPSKPEPLTQAPPTPKRPPTPLPAAAEEAVPPDETNRANVTDTACGDDSIQLSQRTAAVLSLREAFERGVEQLDQSNTILRQANRLMEIFPSLREFFNNDDADPVEAVHQLVIGALQPSYPTSKRPRTS